MSDDYAVPVRPTATGPVYRVLSAFPIAAFTLTVVTDLAYWRTANLLWLHFSEWLLFAGISFGVLAGIVRLVEAATGRVRLPFLYYVAGAAVLILATINNFLHTADGITAVMPWGLTASVLTVVAMLLAGVAGRIGDRHA